MLNVHHRWIPLDTKKKRSLHVYRSNFIKEDYKAEEILNIATICFSNGKRLEVGISTH